MTTLAMIGAGFELRSSNEDSPETFTAIPEVKSYDSSETVQEVDATHFGSTFVERIPGLPDRGSMTFRMNLIPGNTYQERLDTDRSSFHRRYYQIAYPDSPETTKTFLGLVTAYGEQAQPNGVIESTFTIAISGDIQ